MSPLSSTTLATETNIAPGSIPSPSSQRGYAKDVLVETEWLEKHLEDADLRIVEVDEDPSLYAQAHIPGAIGFDWRQDLQDPLRRDFLDPQAFSKLFSSRGISDDHTVVLYGDRDNWFAAYTYWYLKYYGHQQVLLLNGGRKKWLGEDRVTTTELPDFAPSSFTIRDENHAIRAQRDEILELVAIASESRITKLVDVRSPAEFSGEIITPDGYKDEGAQRAGHIPGATNIPWAQAVAEDGTFKPAQELVDLYENKGVLSGDIIAYCRIGERSAHTWFVLHELLGQDNVKNYDGSWTEYGNLVGPPVETGA